MAEVDETVDSKDVKKKVSIITYTRDELLEMRSLSASNTRPKGIDAFLRETERLVNRIRDDQEGSDLKDPRKRDIPRPEGGMTLGPQRLSFITGCRPTAGARRQLSLQEKLETSEKPVTSNRTAGERLHIVRNEKGGLVKKTLPDVGPSGSQNSRDDWRTEDNSRRQGKETERWSRTGDGARDWRADETRVRGSRHKSWREQSDHDSRGYGRRSYSSQYAEEMPSWFTQGPESQDDRIDIGGFEDSEEEEVPAERDQSKPAEKTNGQEKESPTKDEPTCIEDKAMPDTPGKDDTDEPNLAAIPGFNAVLSDLVFSEDSNSHDGAKSRFKNFFSSTNKQTERDQDSPAGFNFINLDSLLVSGQRTPTPPVPDPSSLQGGSIPVSTASTVPVARAPGVPPDQLSPADLTANLKRMLCLDHEPAASATSGQTPLEPPAQAPNPQGVRTVQELEAGLSRQQTQSNEQIAAVKQLFAMQRMQQERGATKQSSPRHLERRPQAEVQSDGRSPNDVEQQRVVLRTNMQRLLVYQHQLQAHGERIHHEAQQVLVMHQQALAQQVTPPANLESNYLQLQYAYSQVRQSMQQAAAAITDVQQQLSRLSRVGMATGSTASGSLAQANRISSPVVLSQQPPSTSVAAPTPIHPARGLGSPSRIRQLSAQHLTERARSPPKPPLTNTSKSAFSFTPTQVMRQLARSEIKSESSSSAASPTADGPSSRSLASLHATQEVPTGRAVTSNQASLGGQQSSALHQLQGGPGEVGRPLRAVTGRNGPPAPDVYAELSMQRQAREAVMLGAAQRPVVGVSSQLPSQRPIVGAVQNDAANRSNPYYQQQQQQQLVTALRAMNQTRMSTGVAPSSYQQLLQHQQLSSAIQQQRQQANLQAVNAASANLPSPSVPTVNLSSASVPTANAPSGNLAAAVLASQTSPYQHLARQQAAVKARDAGNAAETGVSVGQPVLGAVRTPGGPGGDAANNNLLSALLNPALAEQRTDGLPALPSQALSLDELEATG